LMYFLSMVFNQKLVGSLAALVIPWAFREENMPPI